MPFPLPLLLGGGHLLQMLYDLFATFKIKCRFSVWIAFSFYPSNRRLPADRVIHLLSSLHCHNTNHRLAYDYNIRPRIDMGNDGLGI